MAVGPFLVALLVVAVTVLGLYLLYGMVNRAFRAVGFTAAEAGLILLGTFIGSGIDIPIWPTPVGGGWILAINVGGAVVPLLVAAWLLRRIPSMAMGALVGSVVVALATYLVTRAEPTGIAVPIGLALVPPVVAAAMSLTAFWREEDHAAPLAYVCGTFGTLVGADVLRLWEFLAQVPPEPGAMASIGGAAVFDMVFLTGVVAVGLDMMVFRRRQKEHASTYFVEGEAFTVNTSPERLANWTYRGAPQAAVRTRPAAERMERATTRVREAPRPPARPAPVLASSASGETDGRLSGHQAWEEQMRRRRDG